MSLNILINELVGIIPVLGDAFSFWFKSNARNYDLLRQHTATSSGSRRSDWLFVGGVLVVLFAIVCAGIAVSFLVLQQFARLLIR